MTKQTQLRTTVLEQNQNISFPVGTAKAIQKYSWKLDFTGKYLLTIRLLIRVHSRMIMNELVLAGLFAQHQLLPHMQIPT